MTRCTTCSVPLRHLVCTEQGVVVVVRCSHCDTQCDPYLELVGVQACLDVFLLRRPAWAHVVHNLKESWKVLLPLLMFSILVETYAATTLDAYTELLRNAPSEQQGLAVRNATPPTTRCDAATAMASSFWYHPTLRLVDNLRSPRLGLLRLHTMPESCLYGLLEYVFVTLTLMWGSSWLTTDVDPVDGVLRSTFTATALVWSLKSLFALFLIWDIPLYLVVMVDLLSVLWLLRAVRTIAPRATPTSSVLVCALAVGARFAFRGVTRWCTLYLTADLLMGIIQV